MAKVTSKLQVTIPKVIADAHGIEPGAELVFESAGDVIHVRPARRKRVGSSATLRARIAAFDEGAKRQASRDLVLRREHQDMFTAVDRGWRREELYDRGVPR
jgi:AbrB family looped-hinge helix DNA binding protein